MSRADAAEVRATFLAVAAWCLGCCALFDTEGDPIFRLAAGLVGTVTTLPALISLLADGSGQSELQRWMLAAGSAVLGSLGLAYVGAAEPWRNALAYLLPAALLAAAAGTLTRARSGWPVRMIRGAPAAQVRFE